MSLARAVVAASLALLVACVPACRTAGTAPESIVVPQPGTPAANWLADVSGMAAATDNGERRKVLQARLEALDIRWRTVPFEINGQHGINLLADLDPTAQAPVLMIGAHFDRVDAGHGATDNASGSATVLALAERFKRTPLRRHRLAIAFWDLEERGMLGAQAYVATNADKPELYVNFDVFGWGDTVWMMAPDTTSRLLTGTREATTAAGLGLNAGTQYPPTDHLPFLKANWPAVSYSLVDGDEIPLILEAYAGRKPKAMPKVMRVIHSHDDTLAQLDATAALRAVDALEDALRRWDAAEPSQPAATAE